MSIFGKGSKDGELPGPAEMFLVWDEGKDEEKHALARQILEHLRARLGGKIVVDPDDDETFELRFEAQGFPTRIKLDASFSGDVELEAKFENRRGILSLEWDEDRASRPAVSLPLPSSAFVPPAADAWAEEDAASLIFDLGRGAYVSEFAGQARGMLRVIEELSEDDRTLLLEGVADLRICDFTFDDDRVSLGLYDELQELAESRVDVAERIDGALGLLAWGVSVFSQGHAKVEPRIRVMIGGQPLDGRLEITACPACGKTVNLGGGPFCPACGSKVR